MFKLIACVLIISSSLWAYNPAPVQKSAAELKVADDLAQAASDSAKLAIAETALNAHPDDIPALIQAQDVMFRLKDDPAGYFKTRAESSRRLSDHYLAARASEDTLYQAEQSAWIQQHFPGSYWGFMLSGEAEWSRANPDLKQVQRSFERAAQADPSRPEAYLYLGYLFADANNWTEARKALEAGAVADPQDKSIRERRLTAYAELRDADAYFNLMSSAYSSAPLECDLALANADGRLSTADLLGRTTVLEFWAFT